MPPELGGPASRGRAPSLGLGQQCALLCWKSNWQAIYLVSLTNTSSGSRCSLSKSKAEAKKKKKTLKKKRSCSLRLSAIQR